MEDKEYTIFEPLWHIVAQEMVTQQIQTPQGIQYIQQPVNVPVYFRSLEEVQRFLGERKAEAQQGLTLYYGYRDTAQTTDKWYYGGGKE